MANSCCLTVLKLDYNVGSVSFPSVTAVRIFKMLRRPRRALTKQELPGTSEMILLRISEWFSSSSEVFFFFLLPLHQFTPLHSSLAVDVQ